MKYMILIVQLIPALIDIIKKVEEILPEGNKGAEKIKLVKDILVTVLSDTEKMWPTIEKVITVIVEFLNATGVFKKSK